MHLSKQLFFAILIFLLGVLSGCNNGPAPEPSEKDNSFPITYSLDRDIFVINSDGDNKINLTNTPDRVEQDPILSPDLSQIAFRILEPNRLQSHLSIMNVDGSDELRIVSGDVEAIRAGNPSFQFEPAWSPDGTRIAFLGLLHSRDSGNLYVVDVNNGNISKIETEDNIAGISFDRSVVWSPDGTNLAFTARVPIPGSELVADQILVARADGTGAHLLLKEIKGEAINPVWSPDGTELAFGYRMFEEFFSSSDLETWNYKLSVINNDGSNLRVLSETPLLETGDIVWSHDGANLAFVSDENQISIYVTDTNGSNSVKALNISEVGELVWSKDDDSFVYFGKTVEDEAFNIYHLSVEN